MRLILLIILMAFAAPAFSKKLIIPYMGRNYTLVIPEKSPAQKKPLLVLLHGCKQSPEIILEGTRLDQEAIASDFYVLAPEQTIFHNVDHCWNWFLSVNQMRGSLNEMGQIIGAIDLVSVSQKIDKEKIFVAGISAGGVMAHNLSACYPDVFAGAAIHSGLTYKIAENMIEAQTVLTASQLKSPSYLGKRAWECAKDVKERRLKRMVMIHGDLDKRVDAFHTKLISESNEVQMDYLDDQKRNNSQVFILSETNVSFAHGYSAVRMDKTYHSVDFIERSYIIKGLGHAWGGGKPITDNFDAKAPSSNDLFFKFLQLKK